MDGGDPVLEEAPQGAIPVEPLDPDTFDTSSCCSDRPGSACTPEKIARRVFDLVNQIRGEYGLCALEFSNDLSFLAGEHACKMSTNTIPYSHEGFISRQSQVPLATAFSENIIRVKASHKTGREIVVHWLQKSSCFSRILGGFTHTGVGAAESDDGTWYCTQVFASYGDQLSRKSELLVVARFVNRIRVERGLPGLSIAIAPSSRLAVFAKTKTKESLLQLEDKTCTGFFYGCKDAQVLVEAVTDPADTRMIMYLARLQENEKALEVLLSERFSDIGFYQKPFPDGTALMMIILGKSPSVYTGMMRYHSHFPLAYRCLQLVNDYRLCHRKPVLWLSHQFCKAADRHCEKIASKKIEAEYRMLAKKICTQIPSTELDIGVYILPSSLDPLRELLLMWASHPPTREKLLGNIKHFGFGLREVGKNVCYAVRIVGTKLQHSDDGSPVCSDQLTPQYLPMSSDDEEQI